MPGSRAFAPQNSPDHLNCYETFDLNFTLLAGGSKEIANHYGVFEEKNMSGKKVMGVIDRGKIAKLFSSVKPEGRAEAVLSPV